MANSNSSSFLSVSNAHIDSLISYVLDVKPYHSKLSEVVEEFLFEDTVNVKVAEKHESLAVLGPDFLNSAGNPNLKVWDIIGASRPAATRSAERTIISDGVRKIFPVPLTVFPKLLSHASQENFTIGVNDDQQVVGLTRGVFSPRRFNGPGIPRVLVDGTEATESVDFHVSHGVFSFNTTGGATWKELDISSLGAFAQNPGELAYDSIYKKFGTIINIIGTTYEEWTLTWNTDHLVVVGSLSGNIGSATFGVPFTSANLSFEFTAAYGDDSATLPTISNGDQFVLTPRSKITVATTAPNETWSIVKTNPIALQAAPAFTRASGPAPSTKPALNIFTQSLEWTPGSAWTITFNSPSEYVISANLPGYPVTVELINGCSYMDSAIHFTIIPPLDGFKAGDKFTFNVKPQQQNFLVYGSVSGWQTPAAIGQWYWNGKIGFKIPKLEYFAFKRSATISTSSDGVTFTPVVVNAQELNSISYINNAFIAAGGASIVAQSIDGTSWSTDLTSFATINNRLVIVGQDGVIAETEDGITWYRVASHTGNFLRGIDTVPTTTAIEAASPNLLVVVGDYGTILTSLNAFGWETQSSGVAANLRSVTHSTDWIVVVGDRGTILRSQDRLSWIIDTSPTSQNLNRVKYLNGAFWSVGDLGTIITSTDGINWSSRVSNTTAELNDITFGLGQYIAVGVGGVTCTSTDGVSWTATEGKQLNAIEFAGGVFVTLEHKVTEIANFTPLRPVHSVADPSVYTLIFRDPVGGGNPVGGTVESSAYGFRKGFKVNQPWADHFCSFQIGAGTDPYSPGEQIDVYLAPKSSYVVRGNYDELPYEATYYDSHVGEIEYPLGLMEQYFSFYHSNSSVIFPNVTSALDGKKITIDKAFFESVNFRIGQGSSDQVQPPSSLASEDGWIPLEFRYFDRRVSNSSIAEFPDLATYFDAYLASDPDTKVFTIAQPRYQTTNRPASAVLTFDDSFFGSFLKEKTSFSLRFNQADSYEQLIRVKINENFRMYARVRLDFSEIARTNISDISPATWETMAFLNQADSFSTHFAEGGILPLIGYDFLPYDSFGFDLQASTGYVNGMLEVPPGSGNFVYTGNPSDFAVVGAITTTPAVGVTEQDVDSASPSFDDDLQILVKHLDGSHIELAITYDVNDETPDGGVYVAADAQKYVVTHNSPSTPNVIIYPSVGAPYTVSLAPDTPYSPAPGSTWFSGQFTLPPGSAPFRMVLMGAIPL